MCLLIPAPAGSVLSHGPRRLGRGSRALWEEATLPAPWENGLHPGIEALVTVPPGEGLGSGPRALAWEDSSEGFQPRLKASLRRTQPHGHYNQGDFLISDSVHARGLPW